MTKPDLMAELAEVVRLAGKATPGPWVRTQLANVVVREWRDEQGLNQVIAGCHSDDWLCTAAVNFLRTHHAEIEALVKIDPPVVEDYQTDLSASKLDKLANRIETAVAGQDSIDAARVIRSFFRMRCLARGRTKQIWKWRERALKAERHIAAMHNSAREGL